ncbi:MAG: tyrosine protein kinase [Flavobacteriaceae bacterium]|nr:tyrosine protein kinase [Flavobacteriaceae bacterium]|tara:strand:+ start:74447 stop:76822 length:2376 start_codon:yes stop_codon:yes gene_type:complete
MQPAPVFNDGQEFSLKDILQRYTQRWYWFLLAVIISLVAAKIYLRYTIPSYQSKASILIKDDASDTNLGGVLPFSQAGYIRGVGGNSVANELAILKSKRLISEVVKELNLNIKYENIGSVITSEIYQNKPFIVQYLAFNDSLRAKQAPKLFFKIISETEFEIFTENKSIDEVRNFGESLEYPFGEITVIPIFDSPYSFSEFIGKTISVRHSLVENIALQYQNSLSVQNDSRYSNVINFSLNSPVREKAEDFIDELISKYNEDAINDRNQVARSTSNFIDSRLEIITRELDSVEQSKEAFKSRNRLTDIETEAQIILENASEFDKRQLDVGTQLELANTMLDYMNSAGENDLLPTNIALQSEGVPTAISNYNQLLLERNRLLKNSTLKNPVVENLNNQISQIRSGIAQSLENQKNNLQIALRDLNYKEASLNTQIAKVPRNEKLYREINRQQGIKEQLFLFLLQQREEASISLAVTAPKAKIIDSAFSSRTPISPNRMLIYLGALLAGLLIPFLIIYLYYLINTKINNRTDVERLLPTTDFLGEIPRLSKSDSELVQKNDRSMLAESFRILRTNLQYQVLNKITGPETPKIFVTSTVKGEGKTFVAFNLAITLALTGKKVMLVGADIRNPQLHRYLPEGKGSTKGLTEYIFDDSVSIQELIQPSTYNENLSIIHSGAIPPNPAELLLSPRTEKFFEELQGDFDYIIVDTAPAMLVTDTVLINKYADTMLYVVRANYTDKKLINFLKDSLSSKRLSKVSVVLNGVSQNNFGYGNKYGYSYTQEKKSFFKKWFS